MKLKGTTKIELTNVKTGEKEVYQNDNFVTEFAEEYFRECGALNINPLGSLQNARPIDDLFGGIMLFDKKINQNTDDTGNHSHPLYCPAGTKMIANGSIDFASNSNATELGQYNSEESGTPNNHQRMYVYDWGTNEGNGKINCVCLTSRAGGYIGAGNTTSNVKDTSASALTDSLFAYPGTGVGNRTIESGQDARIAGLDLSQGQVALISDTAKNALAAGSVTVNWYDVPVSKLQPFVSKLSFDETQLTARRTQTKTFTARAVNTARVLGGTGYILLLGVASGTTITNGSTVYAVQLNKDGTVTEKTFTVSSIATSVNLGSTYFVGGKIIGNDLYIASGYLQGQNDTVIFRIKGDGSTVNLTQSGNGARTFLVNEGRVYLGTQKYYDTQTEAVYITNAAVWHSYTSMYYRFGMWQCYDCPLIYSVLGTNSTTGVLLSPLSVVRPPCNWLSTINNLSQEIEKTAEKTMKVTYTLTLGQS